MDKLVVNDLFVKKLFVNNLFVNSSSGINIVFIIGLIIAIWLLFAIVLSDPPAA